MPTDPNEIAGAEAPEPVAVGTEPAPSGPSPIQFSSSTEGHALRYQAEIDLAEENTSHVQVILAAGSGKNVLEVGPATGSMTRVLRDRGCKVTCIEVDPAAAEIAAKHCDRMIVGSVEQLNLSETFGEERFDVVIFSDVLEHLVDPSRVLRAVRPLIAPGGYVCSSIPNVAHGSIRLALLTGRFDYSELGLMDRTHLRFFTKEGMRQLFAAAGYAIREWRRVEVDLFSTELGLKEGDYPTALVDSIRQFPDHTTYQYVVTAEPADRPGGPNDVIGEGLPPLEKTFVPIWNLEAKAAELEELNATLSADLADRNASLYAVESELLALRQAHDVVLNRLGYQLLLRLVGVVDRAAPWGTMRGRIILLLGSAVRVLLEQGPRVMLLKIVKIWEWGPPLVKGGLKSRREEP